MNADRAWNPKGTFGAYILWSRTDPIDNDKHIYKCCHENEPPKESESGYILASSALRQKGL